MQNIQIKPENIIMYFFSEVLPISLFICFYIFEIKYLSEQIAKAEYVSQMTILLSNITILIIAAGFVQLCFYFSPYKKVKQKAFCKSKVSGLLFIAITYLIMLFIVYIQFY